MSRYLVIVLSLFTLVAPSASADQFDAIKKKLAEADCYSVRFISVLSSSVFDTKDSSEGFATIARDGRYHIKLGNDIYSFDGKIARSYSQTTNQLIVERVDSGRVADKEISFLSRLDEYYVTKRTKRDGEFALSRKAKTSPANIPDSMTVKLDAEQSRIARIEYFDINDEAVSIELVSQRFNIDCADNSFTPTFPDSAETVKL